MLDILLFSSCGQNDFVCVVVVLPYKRQILALSLHYQALCLPPGPLPHAEKPTQSRTFRLSEPQDVSVLILHP